MDKMVHENIEFANNFSVDNNVKLGYCYIMHHVKLPIYVQKLKERIMR